jgi:ATP-dependent Clp protease ATP-binding subunit ClpA
MTTNVGADFLDKNHIGFTQLTHSSDLNSSIKKVFTPEFRNRLDAIVHFNPLPQHIIFKVVNKEIAALALRLKSKNVEIILDDSGLKWLAEHGYDQKMGARPIARIIKDKIAKPLADELLFGLLSNGGEVLVRAINDVLVIDCFNKENINPIKPIVHEGLSSSLIH